VVVSASTMQTRGCCTVLKATHQTDRYTLAQVLLDRRVLVERSQKSPELSLADQRSRTMCGKETFERF